MRKWRIRPGTPPQARAGTRSRRQPGRLRANARGARRSRRTPAGTRGRDHHQVAAAIARPDLDRPAAEPAGRSDRGVLREHRPHPERVDGAHRGDRDGRQFDAVPRVAVAERVCACNPAVCIQHHKIAVGEPSERAGHPLRSKAGDERDLTHARTLSRRRVEVEHSAAKAIVRLIEAVPLASDEGIERRAESRAGGW